MPIHHRFFPEHSLLSLVWEGSLEQAEILHASDKWLESLGDADGVTALTDLTQLAAALPADTAETLFAKLERIGLTARISQDLIICPEEAFAEASKFWALAHEIGWKIAVVTNAASAATALRMPTDAIIGLLESTRISQETDA